MRAIVLGAAGMLGHKLYQELSRRMPTFATVRRAPAAYARYGIFDERCLVGGVDIASPHDLHRAFAVARPTVVFNAIGIVKQLREAQDPVLSLEVNALFPHRLAALCEAVGARLVHLSTDCVFSGRRGRYEESDLPDPEDLYGRTKLLGEVALPHALTIRTSMIGRELHGAHGLVEWMLSQRGGRIRGFRRAIFSGLTTIELARVLADVAEHHPELHGVWQLSAEPISKYDLLRLIDGAFELGVEIEPDEAVHCDRSLDSGRFREATGYQPRPWPALIDEMRHDPTPYDSWKAT